VPLKSEIACIERVSGFDGMAGAFRREFAGIEIETVHGKSVELEKGIAGKKTGYSLQWAARDAGDGNVGGEFSVVGGQAAVDEAGVDFAFQPNELVRWLKTGPENPWFTPRWKVSDALYAHAEGWCLN